MRELPICEICGLEVAKVFVCSKCDARFCEECGNIKSKLCYDCLSWNEEDEEEKEDDEDEEWEKWPPP